MSSETTASEYRIPEHFYSRLAEKAQEIVMANHKVIRDHADVNVSHDIFIRSLMEAMEYSWTQSKHHMYDAWQGFKEYSE